MRTCAAPDAILTARSLTRFDCVSLVESCLAIVRVARKTDDIVAFATAIEGLDVTHSAYAYRDENRVLRVLHAPRSGGMVEITRSTLPEYVRAIRRSTGILLARPV